MAKHELDLLYVKNPTERSKTVKWGGIEYTLGAGQQIIWQRFLAEHFAKHLANDILLLKEKAHKDAYIANGGHMADYKPVAYVNSKKHRPPVIGSILVGVYSYYQPQKPTDPNMLAQQELNRINSEQQGIKEPEPTNIGVVNDDRTGAEVKTEFDADDEDDAAVADLVVGQENTMPLPPPPAQPPAQPGMPAQMGVPTIPPMAPPAASTQPSVAPTPPSPQTAQEGAGDVEKVKRPQLLAEAKKLGLTVPFGATNEQIKQLIVQNHG